MRRIAVADWDNTMREGFTLGDWASFLAKRGKFPFSLAESIDDDMRSYADRGISYEELADRVTAKYAKGLCGEAQDAIMQAAVEFVAADQRLFDFAQPLASLLESCRVPLILVSGCPREPLLAYQQVLGAAKVYALTLEVEDGLYTSQLLLNPTLSTEKARIIGTLAQDSEIILALGDSKSDLPMLEAASHSVIVDNPDLTPKGHRAVHYISSHSDEAAAASLTYIVHQAIQELEPWASPASL